MEYSDESSLTPWDGYTCSRKSPEAGQLFSWMYLWRNAQGEFTTLQESVFWTVLSQKNIPISVKIYHLQSQINELTQTPEEHFYV